MYINYINPLIMAIFAVIMALNINIANSETYKWVDSKGSIHFSDQPPNQNNISPGVKVDNIEPRNEKSGPANNDIKHKRIENIYYSAFSSDSELSDKVKVYLTMLIAKDILSASDINRIKTDEDGIAVFRYAENIKKGTKIDILNVFGSPDPRYSSPESTWNVFNNARKNYNIDTALDCITPGERDRLRRIFLALKRGDLIEIGKNVVSIDKAEIIKNRATYLEKYKSNGEMFAGDIVFVRIFGNWKIEEF